MPFISFLPTESIWQVLSNARRERLVRRTLQDENIRHSAFVTYWNNRRENAFQFRPETHQGPCVIVLPSAWFVISSFITGPASNHDAMFAKSKDEGYAVLCLEKRFPLDEEAHSSARILRENSSELSEKYWKCLQGFTCLNCLRSMIRDVHGLENALYTYGLFA